MAAGALGWCMSISRMPQTLAPAIVATIHEPLVFLLACNLILLVVGCFMEALAAMLILIPILVPAAISFGIDPVQFGADHDLQPDPGHDPSADRRRAVRHVAHRRYQLRDDVARDPALAGAAADRAASRSRSGRR